MKKLLYILTFVALSAACSSSKTNETPNQENNAPIITTEATYEVEITKDIVYAEGLSHESINSQNSVVKQLTLDAYVPKNSSDNRPAIMLIHGGGFKSGSKESGSMTYLANYFAARGWVAFSINYRLQNDLGTVPQEWVNYIENANNVADKDQAYALYPASRDAKAALRWVFANLGTYKINSNYVSVGGGSAGAVSAIMLGVTEAEDYYSEISVATDPTLTTTNATEDVKVRAILDFWGSGVTASLINDLYGKQRFGANDAPIIIIHGTNDAIVDFAEAEKLRGNYINSGVNYEFYPLQNQPHSAWNATVNGKRLEELCFDFLVKELSLNKEEL
ncbi:carboxylesterase family protein [Tenacibaculum sp. MEBiC06402]|uniref:carboxylesterase family protein n=1 Tax=unclassified Tenacibaculum TaxID=2635139 RepID=UPI003B999DD0